MKAIIKGKRYDTDTAECLSAWDNGQYSGDFGRVEESLYRTCKGAYFLLGEGGANTEYAVPMGGNVRSGSSEIVPMSEAEARVWLERTEDFDALEQLFGTPSMTRDPMEVEHFCSDCGEQISSATSCCPDHPDASVDSVPVYRCGHCGCDITVAGLPDAGGSCPTCRGHLCSRCAGGWC